MTEQPQTPADLDATQDDEQVSNTDATPDPAVDGPQDDVSQEPVNETEAQAEVDNVGDDDEPDDGSGEDE